MGQRVKQTPPKGARIAAVWPAHNLKTSVLRNSASPNQLPDLNLELEAVLIIFGTVLERSVFTATDFPPWLRGSKAMDWSITLAIKNSFLFFKVVCVRSNIIKNLSELQTEKWENLSTEASKLIGLPMREEEEPKRELKR